MVAQSKLVIFVCNPFPICSLVFSETLYSYVTSGEIFQYFKDVAKKHDLEHYIKFQHTVKEAVWDEESGKWRLKIFDATSGKEIDDECDVLLNAAGFLK